VALDSLKPLALQALYGDLLSRGLSGGTVLNLHLVLTQALGQAVRWGLIPANPAAAAQPPRPRRPELALMDPAAVERILEATMGTSMELPVAMAIATGMRRGEILALRWKDLDPDLTVAHVRRSLQTTGGVLVFSVQGPVRISTMLGQKGHTWPTPFWYERFLYVAGGSSGRSSVSSSSDSGQTDCH
jgi:integrase